MSGLIIPDAEPFLFSGGKTGCLLIHGFTGTPREMRLLGEALAARGHTALGVRLTGHATQPVDMLRTRWQDWLASAEDGYHLLQGISDSIFVVGLSMGGILSLILATRLPVAGVVAMSTPHHLPDDPRVRFLRIISLFKPFMPKGPPAWFDHAAYQQHISYPADPTEKYLEVKKLLEMMRAGLPSIQAPALLINSRQDPTVTPEERHMDLIYDELGSHIKKKVWIENCGHVITRDLQRDKVAEEVITFVDEVIQTKSSIKD